MTCKINIPTINDSPQDFSNLFTILDQLNDCFLDDVVFDFSDCEFLRPNAVAFLGGIAKFAETNQLTNIIKFSWESVQKDVLMNLRQNGFAGSFGYPSYAWEGNSIPYREDHKLDANEILDYLSENWLGRGWIHVSELFKNRISEKLCEIYINAFDHAESEIGVYTCGQHFKKNNELLLSIVDFGNGIPNTIKNFLRSALGVNQLTDAKCLQWAFQTGNTTKPDTARGLGLDLLKEFIQLNQGKLEVYSNNAYAIINKDEETFNNIASSFNGTFFHITLKCDESYYCFASEE